MANRRPIPFPLELLDHPQIERLKGNQFGVFFRLVLSFWKTGIPIPTGDYDRACLAQIDIATMQRYRETINTCLSIAMPQISVSLASISAMRDLKTHNGRLRAAATLAKKRLKRLAKNNLLTDGELKHENLVPVAPNPYDNQYNKDRIDMPAYISARNSKAKNTGAKFKD